MVGPVNGWPKGRDLLSDFCRVKPLCYLFGAISSSVFAFITALRIPVGLDVTHKTLGHSCRGRILCGVFW